MNGRFVRGLLALLLVELYRQALQAGVSWLGSYSEWQAAARRAAGYDEHDISVRVCAR